MNKARIPTILGLLLLVVGLGVGILLVENRQDTRVGALDIAPQDVRVTNVSDKSITVSWTTDRDTIGFVQYGESSGNLSQTQVADKTTPSTVHYATLPNLKPQKTYYFKINSQGTEFDNNGIPWEAETGSTLSGQGNSLILSGQVLGADQTGVKDAIVYITIGSVQPLSARTSATGSWLISLSGARSSTLSEFATITADSSLVEIFVQAGSQGVSNAQVYPQSANPLPKMELGNTYDFKGQTAIPTSSDPSANITLGGEESTNPSQSGSQKTSGFNTNSFGDNSSTNTKRVSLDSVDQGEQITTTKPEFFGSGTPGLQFEILIQSDPQSSKLTVSSTGNWKWSPPADLPPGEHTVTLKWTDAGGILRMITRTFTVQAANEPAFVSTPSASLAPTRSPSPTPTKSPSPTPVATKSPTPTATSTTVVSSPSPTPTKKPTATPRVSVPSTDSAVPVSGSLTATLPILSLASILITGGYIAWRKS